MCNIPIAHREDEKIGKGYVNEGFTTDDSEAEHKHSTKKKKKVKKTHQSRQRTRQFMFESMRTKRLHYSLVDTPYVSIPFSNIYSQAVSSDL